MRNVWCNSEQVFLFSEVKLYMKERERERERERDERGYKENEK